MVVLTCDLDPNDEVFQAIQLILNLISSDRKKLDAVQHERDSLLDLLKSFETERLSDELLTTKMDGNRRKRVKMELENSSPSDDLNAAFSSSLNSSMYEDEVVEPTQVPPEKSIKGTRGYNNENDKGPTSPTMLSKFSTKKHTRDSNKKEPTLVHGVDVNEVLLVRETKSMSLLNESSKWRSKAKNVTPRHSVEIRCMDSSSSIQPKTNIRKKLSLGVNEHRLKQSTINFNKCDEETFFEGASIHADKIQSRDIKEIQYESLKTDIKSEPMSGPSTESDSIILMKSTDEIITVDASQPTPEIFQHVFDASSQKNRTNYLHCDDCEKFYSLLGRNVNKNPPKKYGVCSKHYRKNVQLDTPPGFWKPTMNDSESE